MPRISNMVAGRLGPLVLALAAGWSAVASGDPVVRAVNPRGIRIGEKSVLVLEGEGLATCGRLIVAAPIGSQRVLEGSTDERLELEIEMGDAMPGIYPAWMASNKGLSNAFALGIDFLPQAVIGDRLPPLPVAVSGELGGGEIKRTRFEGRSGETVIVEVEAARLGAAIQPTVRLLDARGVQLAFREPTRHLGGDVRLTYALSADGEYTLELHDHLYGPDSRGPFRMKIGQFDYADAVFPPVAPRGANTAVRYFAGNIGAGSYAHVPAECDAPAVQVLLPPGLRFSGPLPGVLVSRATELIAASGRPDPFQLLPKPPVGFCAVLAQKGENCRCRVPVLPGDTLRIEVLAERAGSPLDATLTVMNVQGQVLATADDQPRTKDPAIDLDVPEGVSSIDVEVSDMQGRGGPDYFYHLSIQSRTQAELRPLLGATALQIPRGGSAVLPITFGRQAYDGPLEVQLDGLPPHCIVRGTEIPAGVDASPLTLSTDQTWDDVAWVGLVVRSKDRAIERRALAAEMPATLRQGWLRTRIPVWTAPAGPVLLAWTEDMPCDVHRGGSEKLTLAVRHDPSTHGTVRFALITNQPPPKKKVRNIFGIEEEVDDVERTLRMAREVTAGPNDARVELPVTFPPDLPERPYQVVVRGELLDADGKTVVSTFHTPAREFRVRTGLELAVSNTDVLEVRAGDGPTGSIRGSVVRGAGLDVPVVVTLVGLPDGFPAPTTILDRGVREFALPVRAPYEFATGELKDVRVVARAVREQGDPATRVESRGVGVSLAVVAGEPPPAYRPLVLFEDEAELLANLSDGGGAAALVAEERYRGAASLRIEGGDRLAAVIAGLSAKIRENPAAGQYRYLRFAWKKPRGGAIGLALADGGTWRREDSVRGGLTYSAGGGWGMATVSVADERPSQWQVVTRDLFADFGELELTGLGFLSPDGESAYFDHLILARNLADFDAAVGR